MPTIAPCVRCSTSPLPTATSAPLSPHVDMELATFLCEVQNPRREMTKPLPPSRVSGFASSLWTYGQIAAVTLRLSSKCSRPHGEEQPP